MGKIVKNGVTYSGSSDNADNVKYNNNVSNLDATNVQEAIDKLDESVDILNSNLTQVQNQIVPTASIEMGETASKAYSKGDFLVKDGTLYKVTKAISKDDTLTVGTNIVMTTVGGELSEKSNSTDKWTFMTLTGTNNNVTVPSSVKEFYLCYANNSKQAFNPITIPIELFNYDKTRKFYSYIFGDQNVYIMRTSTENVYTINCTSSAIFGYR